MMVSKLFKCDYETRESVTFTEEEAIDTVNMLLNVLDLDFEDDPDPGEEETPEIEVEFIQMYPVEDKAG